jgi:hypothetical protein
MDDSNLVATKISLIVGPDSSAQLVEQVPGRLLCGTTVCVDLKQSNRKTTKYNNLASVILPGKICLSKGIYLPLVRGRSKREGALGQNNTALFFGD